MKQKQIALCWLLGVVLISGAVCSNASSPETPEGALVEGRYQEAIQLYKTQTLQPDSSSTAFTQLANIYLFFGKVDEAQESILQALAIEPNPAAEYQLAGDIACYEAQRVSMFKALGHAKKCIAHYRKAAQTDPQNATALMSTVRFLMEAPGIAGGDKSLGQEYLAQLKTVSPEHYRTYQLLELSKNGSPADVIEAADRSIDSGISDKENQFLTAMVYLESGATERGQALLQKLVNRDDDFDSRWLVVTAQQKLGESYMQQNQPQKAIPHLEATIALNKNSADSQYYWSRWNLAKAYYAVGDASQYRDIVAGIDASPYKDFKEFAKIFRKERKDYPSLKSESS